MPKPQFAQVPPSSLSDKTATPVQPVHLKTLTFQERKEIFNKQHLIYSSTSSPSKSKVLPTQETNVSSPKPPLPLTPPRDLNNSVGYSSSPPSLQQSQSKRQKIDEPKTEEAKSIEDQHQTDRIKLLTKSIDDSITKSNNFKSLSDTLDSNNEVMPSATEVLNEASQSKGYGQIKTKTFYGGQVIKDVKTLNLGEIPKKASFRLNPIYQSNNFVKEGETSFQNTTTQFEFIGACVKLTKSSLTSGKKGDIKVVNFSQIPETFEYPSYEFVLKEMGIDPSNDPDYQIVPDQLTLSFDSFLPGLSSPSSSSTGNIYYDNQDASNFYRTSSSDDLSISVTKFTKGK